MNRNGDETRDPQDARQDAMLTDALGTDALGADATDTALLSRAVLSRMGTPDRPLLPHLAEVLTAPAPAIGLMLGALIFAGMLGYALVPGELQDLMTLQSLIGPGF